MLRRARCQPPPTRGSESGPLCRSSSRTTPGTPRARRRRSRACVNGTSPTAVGLCRHEPARRTSLRDQVPSDVGAPACSMALAAQSRAMTRRSAVPLVPLDPARRGPDDGFVVEPCSARTSAAEQQALGQVPRPPDAMIRRPARRRRWTRRRGCGKAGPGQHPIQLATRMPTAMHARRPRRSSSAGSSPAYTCPRRASGLRVDRGIVAPDDPRSRRTRAPRLRRSVSAC